MICPEQFYLRNIDPIRDTAGRTITGPGWLCPNGHMTVKFTQGELCSRNWRQFGSVYRIWAGTTPEIRIITTPEHVKHFYSDSNAHLKSHASNGGWLFDEILGSCMGLVNGTRWKAMRTAFEDTFCFRETESSYAAVFKFASEYLKDLAKDGVECVTIDPFQQLKRYPLFCAASKIYGDMTVAEKQTLWDLGVNHTELMRYVLAGGRYRYKSMRFTATGVTRQIQRFSERWMNFNRTMYETRASSRSEQPLIVSIWEGASQGRFTHREVLHTLTEVLFANLDVTSHALSWLIVLLAESPGVQSEVRSESRSVVDESALLGAHALRKDTLLGMALLESLRLKPFTAFSIPEASGEDKFFNKYRVPKNTSVIIDTAAINIKNPFWGEDRECFLPGRFRKIEKSEVSVGSGCEKTRS
ncbi:hypothetical protein SLS60_007305 [Paraconiothyrium brasiliense]|uniref:Cytochrome P450 n=1 Tax=Paraconiothyrium brasiliense TaxID=300254 RepID=A0ABR3R677_9PLEO